MALITQWPVTPEEALENKQWIQNSWGIGTPITQKKLENLETGISILATQMALLFSELDAETYTGLLNNSTRIDRLEKEVGGTKDSSGAYTPSRIDNLQTWIAGSSNANYSGATIATRLTNLDSKTSAIATELFGSDTTSGTSRIDKNDNKIAAIAAELGGGTPDGTSTTYPAAATRLDDLEKELCGPTITRDTTNGGYVNSRLDRIDELNENQNDRLDNIEKLNTTQNTRLATLEDELSGGTMGISGSRLDKLQTWIAGSPTSIYNGSTISTRLDNLQKWIAGSPTAEYGEDKDTISNRLDSLEAQTNNDEDEIEHLRNRATAIEEKNTEQDGRLQTLEIDNLDYNERLDSLEASRTSDESKLGALETDNTTNKADIANIVNEIGGTYSTAGGFNNSQVSKISSIIEKNDTQDSNINKIKVEVWGENKDYSDISRIDELGERTSTVESLSSSNQSRISSAESRIARIEGGAIPTKIFNYTTTNSENSDSLVLPVDSIIDENSIVMVFLNAGTLGLNDITIQDSTATYNVKVSSNVNLRAQFVTGSLLGLYRGNTADIYMFNAPLAL